MVEDSVVRLVPMLQATADVGARGAGVQSEKCIGKRLLDEVVLHGEIIRLGLRQSPDTGGMFIALMHVQWNRAAVIEEFGEHLPSALAHLLQSVAEQHSTTVVVDIAQALIFER